VEDLRVAVVGSGPAGIYAAAAVLTGHEQAAVDVIDRLPTPFGLVRYGVAPGPREDEVGGRGTA
jgi:ferredoxin/flavodoxin---NADP+ reductase